MAIQCSMIQDVRKYETKVFGPFSKRQLICILISIGYTVPIMLLFPLPVVDRIICGCFIAIPGVLCGYIKIDGTPPEVFAIRYIYKNYLTPKKRKRKCKNPYEQELLKIRVSDMDKRNSKKKKMRYSKNPEFHVYH